MGKKASSSNGKSLYMFFGLFFFRTILPTSQIFRSSAGTVLFWQLWLLLLLFLGVCCGWVLWLLEGSCCWPYRPSPHPLPPPPPHPLPPPPPHPVLPFRQRRKEEKKTLRKRDKIQKRCERERERDLRKEGERGGNRE